MAGSLGACCIRNVRAHLQGRQMARSSLTGTDHENRDQLAPHLGSVVSMVP